MDDLKINALSDISFLRVNPVDQLFGHIISFRRQIIINSDFDISKIPGSFLLTHVGRTHRIFITFDEFSCFKCKDKGHRAEDCPNDNIEKYVSDLASTPPITSHENTSDEPVAEPLQQNGSENTSDQLVAELIHHNVPVKRPLSTTSSNTQTSNNNSESLIRKKRSSRKRNKKSPITVSVSEESEPDYTDMEEINDINSELTQEKSKDDTTNHPCTLKEIFAQIEKTLTDSGKQEQYPITVKNLALFLDMCNGPNAQNTLNVVQ